LKKNRNILICPLDWGLGHAGRMIPLARKMQELNNKIFIGAGESQLSFFRNEMQDIVLISFPGFRPWYSRHLPQYLAQVPGIPSLVYHIIKEHFRLRKLVHDYNIDIVISDNRFGLWNNKIKSVYITHQIRIPFPKLIRFLEPAGTFIHRKIIEKYNLCLVPDLPGELNISGRLAHGLKLPSNILYCGILSRFPVVNAADENKKPEQKYNTVILSGPEPQRRILRRKLTGILENEETLTVILEGKPGEGPGVQPPGNIISYNHLTTGEMQKMIAGSETIISRSGYSTIMELISLKCSALIIPTPGQTEQEYLAGYLALKGWFTTIAQKDLGASIPHHGIKADWPDEIIFKSRELLNAALAEVLK